MASFNKVILIGNFVADPELKQTPTGIPVCRFRLAVQRRYVKDQEQTADFIDVVAWRQTAKFVSDYFKKGRPILVCGQLQSRNWTDKDGGKRSSIEVIADEVSFVESKGNSQTSDAPSQYTPANNYGTPAYSSVPDTNFEEITAPDDGLPF